LIPENPYEYGYTQNNHTLGNNGHCFEQANPFVGIFHMFD